MAEFAALVVADTAVVAEKDIEQAVAFDIDSELSTSHYNSKSREPSINATTTPPLWQQCAPPANRNPDYQE